MSYAFSRSTNAANKSSFLNCFIHKFVSKKHLIYIASICPNPPCSSITLSFVQPLNLVFKPLPKHFSATLSKLTLLYNCYMSTNNHCPLPITWCYTIFHHPISQTSGTQIEAMNGGPMSVTIVSVILCLVNYVASSHALHAYSCHFPFGPISCDTCMFTTNLVVSNMKGSGANEICSLQFHVVAINGERH